MAQITITSENTWTNWEYNPGQLRLHISGLSDSTVTIKRAKNSDGTGEQTIRTVTNSDTDNGIFSKIIQDVSPSYWKVGVDTGDYGTDTIVVTLGE